MNFSTGSVAPAIILPLRYYFSRYSSGANLVWNEDEQKRTMDIYEAFDANRTPLQEKPRIVVSRGAFNAGKTGLSDNLAEGKQFSLTRGNKALTNMTIYQGSATVTVEAKNKGTCELLADMALHFLIWSRPIICDAMGWKDFAMPIRVTDCLGNMSEDPNNTIFQVQMDVPWMKEEHWSVKTDGGELKKILENVHLAP